MHRQDTIVNVFCYTHDVNYNVSGLTSCLQQPFFLNEQSHYKYFFGPEKWLQNIILYFDRTVWMGYDTRLYRVR